jgi:hypothetical protein
MLTRPRWYEYIADILIMQYYYHKSSERQIECVVKQRRHYIIQNFCKMLSHTLLYTPLHG